MSSRLSYAMAATIPLSCSWPSGVDRLVLKSLTTISEAPQGLWLMAAKTSSIFEASSGYKYHPMINQHLSPNASWKLTTFAP